MPTVTCKRGHEHERGRRCPDCNRTTVARWRAANPDAAGVIARRYEKKRSARLKELRKIWKTMPGLTGEGNIS